MLVTTSGVQLWSAGQHRVRLGSLVRSEESLAAEGLNKRAFWSPARRLLAVVVRPAPTPNPPAIENVFDCPGKAASENMVVDRRAVAGHDQK